MSKRKFTLVSPKTHTVVSKEVDWTRCFICQNEGDGDKLVYPFKNLGYDKNPENSSYFSTAHNLKEFQQIGELPSVPRKQVEKYTTASELASAFVEHEAVFHKTCMTRYDQQKLQRKIKQRNNDEGSSETPQCSRNTVSANNFKEKCFFCDKVEACGTLHSCQTLYLDMRVRKIAHELADTKLLAKLSEGDMVATEAKYHLKCLVLFYN